MLKVPGYTKVTIIMFRRHVALLDRLAVDVRMRHHVVFSRSAIIRALIDLAMTKDTEAAKTRRS